MINKIIIYIFTISIISTNVFSEEKKVNCNTDLSKLKPACNIIGSGFKKLKKFSGNHKTIGQSLGIKKNNKSMKQFAKENKTIDQTYKNIRKKLKKNEQQK